jgi:transcriptional regulator with XRE-family HTH domain
MGTLGQYLHDARMAKDIELRDAAQQTRISIQYLRALEEEDFSKLPGEVFVKGFLKNYVRFLNLDESEVMKRYAELKPKAAPPAAAAPNAENPAVTAEREARKETSLEPFVWAAVIVILLLVFLFTALPARLPKNTPQPAASTAPAVIPLETAQTPSIKPEKLYLQVDAIEDTWLLVRTDDSPQKKAVLKRGESLTWSADERFLLSYGRAGAVKLLLNGEELAVRGTKESVVRDLAITRAGIVNQPLPAKQPQPVKPKPRPAAQLQQTQPQQTQPQGEQKPEVPPALLPAPPVTAPAQTAPLTPLKPAE